MTTKLSNATNCLASLAMLNPEKVEFKRLHACLSETCDALTDIIQGLRPAGAIERALRFLRLRREVSYSEYVAILEDTEAFAELFVNPEAVALLKSGLSLQTTTMLLGQAEPMRGALLEGAIVPAEVLRKMVLPLKEQVCQVVSAMDKPSDGTINLVKRGLWVVGGASAILINHMTDVATSSGLVQAATAVSGEFGVALILKGVG